MLSTLSVSISDRFRDIPYRSQQFVEGNVVYRPMKFELDRFSHSGDNRGQRSNFDPYISETVRDRPTILNANDSSLELYELAKFHEPMSQCELVFEISH
jgi:hypothetical protein